MASSSERNLKSPFFPLHYSPPPFSNYRPNNHELLVPKFITYISSLSTQQVTCLISMLVVYDTIKICSHFLYIPLIHRIFLQSPSLLLTIGHVRGDSLKFLRWLVIFILLFFFQLNTLMFCQTIIYHDI